MSNNKLSPIRLALEEIKFNQKLLPPASAQSGYAIGKEYILQELEKKLTALLPIEKQFAKDIWDASVAYGCYSDGPCSEYAPDFDELYKGYE